MTSPNALIPDAFQELGKLELPPEGLIAFGKATLRALREAWDAELSATGTQAGEYRAKIKELSTLEYRAEEKPLLPLCRPDNWFAIGDRAVKFAGDWSVNFTPPDFIFGTIGKPRRAKTWGWFQYDEPFKEGTFYAAILVAPPKGAHFLKAEEFKYLRRHSDFARLWMECVAGEPNAPDGPAFLAALKNWSD